jgi:DNA-binding transcriptional regulator GbsR (MarR family)
MRLNPPKLSTGQHGFIEDMGHLLASWGLSRTTGRIYGHLLIAPASVTLDDIVRDLRIAKSGASVSARQLVAIGLARSTTERGSRRLRYEALFDPQGIIQARAASTEAFLRRLREGARVAPEGPRRELNRMARTVEELNNEMTMVLQRIGKRQRA